MNSKAINASIRAVLIAFIIVAVFCIAVFIVGAAINSEVLEDTSIGALMSAIVIFAIVAIVVSRKAQLQQPFDSEPMVAEV